MPDRLDFDSARRALDEIAPTDTWDDATQRAQSLVQLDDEDDTGNTRQRPPHQSLPPTARLVTIVACLLAIVALVTVLVEERYDVVTVPPAASPTTECPSTTQPRAITQGAEMNKRFAAPIASAAAAVVLLGACSDDATTDAAADPGPTTVAKGTDVEFVGDSAFAGQTLSVNVVEEDGEVTGEFSVSDVVFVRVDCSDTDTDGLVILGGTVTKGDPTHLGDVGDLLALIIREGDPDLVAPYPNPNDSAYSCNELLETIPDDPVTGHESEFDQVEDGSNIETA